MSLTKNAHTNEAGELILTPPPSAPIIIECTKCSGTGLYRATAKCYRCAGKGHLTPTDVKRNAAYVAYNSAKRGPTPCAKSRLIPDGVIYRTPKPNVFLCSPALSKALASLDNDRANRKVTEADTQLLDTILDDLAIVLRANKVAYAKGNQSNDYYLKTE